MAADASDEVDMSNVNRWVARKYSIDGETVYMVTGGALASRDAVIDHLHERFPDVIVPENASIRPYRVDGARFVPRAYYIIPMFAGTQRWMRQFKSDAASDGPYYAYRTVTGRIPFKHRWHLLAISTVYIIGLIITYLMFGLSLLPALSILLMPFLVPFVLYYDRSKTYHLTEIVDEHGVAFNDMYAGFKVNGKEHLDSTDSNVIPSSVNRLENTGLARAGEGEPPTIYSDAELSRMFTTHRWASDPLINLHMKDVRAGDVTVDAASIAADIEGMLGMGDTSVKTALASLSPRDLDNLGRVIARMRTTDGGETVRHVNTMRTQ